MMVDLSVDECKLLLAALDKTTFQGESMIRSWLPVFEALRKAIPQEPVNETQTISDTPTAEVVK